MSKIMQQLEQGPYANQRGFLDHLLTIGQAMGRMGTGQDFAGRTFGRPTLRQAAQGQYKR